MIMLFSIPHFGIKPNGVVNDYEFGVQPRLFEISSAVLATAEAKPSTRALAYGLLSLKRI